jgi:hypothetical protein
MENTFTSNNKLIAGILTTGLVISTIFGVYYYNSSEVLEKDKNQISLTADSLQVVKNNLQNEVASLTERLADEKIELDEMTITLENKDKLIAVKQSLINQSRNQFTTLEKNDDLEIAGLETEQNKENIALNEKILLLQKQVLDLKSNVKEIKYWGTADNFSVEVLKPNTKLTSKAKKAKTLRISMRMPEFLKSKTTDSKPVYLTITDNKNNTIVGTIKDVKVKDEDNQAQTIAIHQSKMIDFNKNPQRLSFDYTIKENLKPGVYLAKVYTTDSYLGTVEFKVKDSFWFF